MKITEVFDVRNSDSNLILGGNTYVLIHDFENYKNRLHDHSATLELLTQRALNLSLFRGFPQKLKTSKLSYSTKNEKFKQLQKPKIEGVIGGELLVIKKLLLVNLRSFKIMQKLLQENKELQILLNDSRIFAKRQQQKIEYAKKENESLKKTEIQLKKRLGSFLRQLNRVSKSFVAGFKDDCQDDFKDKVSLIDDTSERNSQKLEFAFNLSTNITYRLRDDANNFLKINGIQQKLSFNYGKDILLKDFNIRLTPRNVELPSNHFFNTNLQQIYVDHEMNYPLLIWQTKNENSHLKELPSKLNIKGCNYTIEKDIQNAIRLHSVNSSIWKSFLLMKTIQEFMVFDQVYELIRAFLIAAEACESETYSETNETMFVQIENSKQCSFASESSSEYMSQSSLTLNEITDEFLDERIREYPRKSIQRSKVFYNLKSLQKKIKNRTLLRKTKRRISKNSFSTIETISIGVGDSYIASVDRESQVDNDILVKPTFKTIVNTKSNVNLERDDFDGKDSIETLFSGRRDFKKSLKSLQDVIKSCQQKTEREIATIKPKKKKINATEKNVNTQRKRDTKVKEVKELKEVKKKNRNSTDFRKNSDLPEMSKMYQIILENRLPRGVSFEYLTPGKSKVQLLFVSNSQDTQARLL